MSEITVTPETAKLFPKAPKRGSLSRTLAPEANVASETAEKSVLAGVGTTPDKPGAPKYAPLPKAASPAPKTGPATGAARYGTGYAVPRAMVAFAKWIDREYPDLAPADPRLVAIASKAYRYFQSSDLNV